MRLKFILPLLALAIMSCKNENTETPENDEAAAEAAIMRKADSLAQAYILTDGHIDLPYRLRSEGIMLITKENGATVIDAGIGEFDFERSRKGGLMLHLCLFTFLQNCRKKVAQKPLQIPL
jgi:membrane dipeptidase